MVDMEGVDPRRKPTRKNMVRQLSLTSDVACVDSVPACTQMREIRALVRGAQPGDRFVFLCQSCFVELCLGAAC